MSNPGGKQAFIRVGAPVSGVFIDALGWQQIGERIERWAVARESRTVALCNVHSVVTASADHRLASALREADLCVADGAPVAWVLRRFGFASQERIGGPDLTVMLSELASEKGLSVYFYGSAPRTLISLRDALERRWPSLIIAGMHSPPFRALTAEEDAADVARINDSGANIVFIGLGCPKQEVWMNEHAGRIHAVTLGVGAAFDFLAGTVSRAPLWMRSSGLEWLHRLLSEPRRLWRRYLVTNTLFVAWIARTWLQHHGRFPRANIESTGQ